MANANSAGFCRGARPARRHLDDLPHQPNGIGCGRAEYHVSVVAGQIARVGVVRATVGAEGQEPVQPGVVVHRERVAASGIGDLSRVGPIALGGPARADQAQWVHGMFLESEAMLLPRRRCERVIAHRIG